MGFMESRTAAGLRIVEEWTAPDRLVPPTVIGQAPSIPFEDGRVEVLRDFLDPLLQQKANADWYRLAVEGGLFSETDRRFLIALSPGRDRLSRWHCVELQSEWDIMSKGADGLLGSAPYRPEFSMLSLDGNVLCFATTWEYAISTSVLKAPHRSHVLRHWAEGLTDGSMDDMGDPNDLPLSVAARRWLDHH
uniref:Uncharacterized protein n=2 Tax=Streptomyces TaxID=1883 RepID=A0A8D3WSX2_STRFA